MCWTEMVRIELSSVLPARSAPYGVSPWNLQGGAARPASSLRHPGHIRPDSARGQGGAAEVLAQALVGDHYSAARGPRVSYHARKTPAVAKLADLARP